MALYLLFTGGTGTHWHWGGAGRRGHRQRSLHCSPQLLVMIHSSAPTPSIHRSATATHTHTTILYITDKTRACDFRCSQTSRVTIPTHSAVIVRYRLSEETGKPSLDVAPTTGDILDDRCLGVVLNSGLLFHTICFRLSPCRGDTVGY